MFKTTPLGMSLTFAMDAPAFSRRLCIDVQLSSDLIINGGIFTGWVGFIGGALSSFSWPSVSIVSEFVVGPIHSALK